MSAIGQAAADRQIAIVSRCLRLESSIYSGLMLSRIACHFVGFSERIYPRGKLFRLAMTESAWRGGAPNFFGGGAQLIRRRAGFYRSFH